MALRHVSLFAGVGGFDVAAEWAGFETVLFCEKDPYCQAVLKKHWPDVPIIDDIRSVTSESISGAVDVISGGAPCQPFSQAGEKRGRGDDRYLWPEMFRVIREIRPTWVVFENVENAVRMVADDIIDDLESLGYSTQPLIVSAYCSGAAFDGKRLFIVAAADHRCPSLRGNGELQTDAAACRGGGNHRGGAAVISLRERRRIESRPYGVAHGVPARVDRLRALGNAVMPQQACPIFAAIAAIEGGRP